jgi:hypothetical protein
LPRRSKLTPDRQQRLLAAVREGNSLRAAAAYAGITEDTLANWRRQNSDFSESLALAEADSERELVGLIRSAAREDWRAAAHLLACRWPADWSQRARLEVDIRTQAQVIAEQLGLDADELVATAQAIVSRQARA